MSRTIFANGVSLMFFTPLTKLHVMEHFSRKFIVLPLLLFNFVLNAYISDYTWFTNINIIMNDYPKDYTI